MYSTNAANPSFASLLTTTTTRETFQSKLFALYYIMTSSSMWTCNNYRLGSQLSYVMVPLANHISDSSTLTTSSNTVSNLFMGVHRSSYTALQEYNIKTSVNKVKTKGKLMKIKSSITVAYLHYDQRRRLSVAIV
jgi:hypothetical protein